MLGTWMAYSMTITLLLALAALGLERSMEGRGLARRGIWLGSMIASFAMSAGALLWPSHELVGPTYDAAYTGAVFEYEVISIAQPVEQGFGSWLLTLAQSLEPALMGLWISASSVLLLYAAHARFRLAGLRRSWRTDRVRGRTVLVSRDVGPAVVGFFRSRIVVPEWVLDGDPALRDLMLAHEQEHLDARDPGLLLSALAMIALTPWNLPLWWQLRRLRLAIELDCDARVLRRVADPRKYASLLLDVGVRRSSPFLAVAAFSQKSTFLERRIRMITCPRAPRVSAVLTAGAMALLLVVTACRVDRPSILAPVETAVAEPVVAASSFSAGASVPVVAERVEPVVETTAEEREISASSDTIPPRPAPGSPGQQSDTPGRLENMAEVQRAIQSSYPPLLRDAGIGGTLEIQMYVTAEGAVAEPLVVRSSGHAPLDRAGLRVAEMMRFSPFKLRGENVGVWVTMPFTFTPPVGAAAPGGAARGAAPPSVEPGRPLAAGVPPFPGPKPLAMLTRPPSLSNLPAAQKSLVRNYPRELLDAGVSGAVTMRVYIGADGKVVETYVTEATNEGFVAAAEATVRMMEFRPAEDDGQAVPVWIEMPINFQSGT